MDENFEKSLSVALDSVCEYRRVGILAHQK